MHKENQRVILTGGTSFLGMNLIKDLAKSYRVSCLVRSTSRHDKIQNVTYHEIDFKNPHLDKALFCNVYAIVHILSIKSAHHPDILAINVNFTKQLVDAAVNHHVEKFLHISSETAQLPGEDLYTKTKKIAEGEVKRLKNHLILRPTVIYGMHDRRNIGFLIQIVKHSFMVPMIGTGRQWIQPIYVGDVSKCIISGLLNDLRGTHVLAGRYPLRYSEMIDLISRALRKRRMKLPIPISICYVLSKILTLCGLPFLQKSQVDNLKMDRRYAIENTERKFRVRFSDPREKIYQLARGMSQIR